MSDANADNVAEVVKAVVKRLMDQNVEQASSSLSITTTVQQGPARVSVDVAQTFQSRLGSGFGLGIDSLSVHATATVVGQPNICVLGLNRNKSGTISLEQKARVTGVKCGVFSNSSHVNSIKSKNSSVLTADFICARGGKDGGKGNFNPDPMTDCPGFEDPLADRPEPSVAGCTYAKKLVVATSRPLSPGVFCGGLVLRNGARVELRAGTYIMKNGPLIVKDGAELIGSDVGLFFIGKGANLLFDRDTTISLEAPKTGVMAGLLMFSSRSLSNERFRILSDDSRILLGTIYLPRNELHVDAGSPIADQSAYTAIVADTMRLYGGPHLVLNTNYHDSSVPVPKGIEGVGQPIRLSK
ncbi:MAG: pilus assembly protein [Hyphomicrobiaceae bacterium]